MYAEQKQLISRLFLLGLVGVISPVIADPVLEVDVTDLPVFEHSAWRYELGSNVIFGSDNPLSNGGSVDKRINNRAMLLAAADTKVSTTHAEETSAAEKAFPSNKQRHLREAAKYRIEFNNDAFFGSDNQFSNGWSLQIHTPVAESWSTVEGPAEPLKKFGAWLPSLSGDGLNYRMNAAIGQIIVTPEEITDPNLIPNDVPYVGVLAVQTTWIAYNDTDFRGFEITLGVVGRLSMAEQTQNFVHNITDSDIAQGWDNQLKNEPVININYMRKNKFHQGGDPAGYSYDTTISGDVELGTLFTAAGARLETRFGTNMPRGFAYHPDSIGRFLTYDATLAPPDPNESSFYGAFMLGASAVGHNIVFDGNVFRDSHSVEKEDFLGYVTIGAHYERPSWGIHLNWTLTTDTVDTDVVTATPDPDNSFGTIMYEWRI
jgi:hypothetical protein